MSSDTYVPHILYVAIYGTYVKTQNMVLWVTMQTRLIDSHKFTPISTSMSLKWKQPLQW